MGKSIDQRVVQMQFDAKQFEKGVNSTIKDVERLKSNLNFDKSADSLKSLNDAGSKFSLSNLTKSVETISSRFSTLGIIGVTALTNITNSAVNAGKQLIASLTIDPIKTGLEEYETKMNSIKTILANTAASGSNLEDVNKALGELNDYSDNTVYNFAQMTDMVSKFAATSGKLDSSVSIVKGMANLAAEAGVENARLQSALYQTSQAMSGAYFMKMDWNSLENAGIATKKFKTDLIAMGKSMGVFDNMSDTLQGLENDTIGFGMTLEQGWLTSEVFAATTAMYAFDDAMTAAAGEVTTISKLMVVMREAVQSGWSVTWEKIIGDKVQSAETLSAIRDGFTEIITPSQDARNATLGFWNENGGRDAMIVALTNSFKALYGIFSAVKKGFKEVFPPKTGQELVDMSIRIRDLTEKFKIGDKTLNTIKTAFKGFFAIISIGVEIIKSLGKGVGKIVSLFPNLDMGISDIITNIGYFLVGLNITIKKTGLFTNVIYALIDGLSNLARTGLDSIKQFMSGFKVFGKGEDLKNITDTLEKRFEPFKNIGKILNCILKGIIGILKTLAPVFVGLANAVGKGFQVLQEKITGSLSGANYDNLFDIINSGLLIGIAIAIKKFIDHLSKIAKSGSGFLRTIVGILDGVKGSLEAYQTSLKASALLKIAAAIGILALSLLLISSIDSNKLTKSLGAISILFVNLLGSLALFGSISTGGLLSMIKITSGMIALSIAVLILASAMKVISSLNSEQIANGLLSIVTLMTSLVLLMKVGKFESMGPSIGLGLIGLSIGILILAKAVEKFGTLDTNVLLQGVGGVTAMLLALGLFTKIAGGSKKMISIAIGLTIISGAMLIFAKAVEKMGNLSLTQIGKGFLGIGGALAIIAAAMYAIPPTIIFTSVGLLTMAAALYVIGKAVQNMSTMSWVEIAKGLVVLAGALTIIAIAMNFMMFALPGAAALLVVATSLAILAPVLSIFSSMSWSEIGRGLLLLAGALAIIGAAGLLLTPVIPALLGLGLSVTLLGTGIMVAATGLLLFSTGLAALAASGTAASIAIVAIVTGLLSLIPFAFTKIGEGLVAFAEALRVGTPAILKAVEEVLNAIIEALINTIPKVVEGMYKLLVALSETILKYSPTLIKNGIEILLAFLKGIKSETKAIVALGVDIMIAFISGLADKIPDVIDMAYTIIINFINGLAEAIRKNTSSVVRAVKNLIGAMSEAMFTVLDEMLGGAISKTEEVVGKFKDIGKNIVDGLIGGVKKKLDDVKDMAVGLGNKVLDSLKAVLGIASPSKETSFMGKMIGIGMTNGIEEMIPSVEKVSKELGVTTGESIAEGVKESTPEVVAATNTMGKSLVESVKGWVDESKKLSKLNLQQELEIWSILQGKYKQGTDARKEADAEVYRLKREFTDKMKAMDDEYYGSVEALRTKYKDGIAEINKEYDDALISRSNSIYKAYGLFDKIEEPEAVTGQQLTENLDSQLDALKDWQRNINALSKRGIADDLLDELKEMGPSAAEQIRALNALSDTELTRYANLWKEKHALARTQAVIELEKLKKETKAKRLEYSKQIGDDLENVKAIWAEKLSKITDMNREELENVRSTWDIELDVLRKDTAKSFEEIKNDIKSGGWEDVGKAMGDGVTKGVKDSTVDVNKATRDMAKQAMIAARMELGIRSPSKKFTEIGKFMMQGMAAGVTKYSNEALQATKKVANNSISVLKDALNNISNTVNSEIDTTPVIRPVIDLNDITSGSKAITDILAKEQALRTNDLKLKTDDISANFNGGSDAQQLKSMAQLTDKLPELIKNTSNVATAPSFVFHVAGNLDKDTAQDIVSIVTKELKTSLRLQGAW